MSKTYGHKLVGGLCLTTASWSVIMAAAPYYLDTNPQTAQYIVLALFMAMIYGLFLAITSEPVLDVFERAEEWAEAKAS